MPAPTNHEKGVRLSVKRVLYTSLFAKMVASNAKIYTYKNIQYKNESRNKVGIIKL